MRCDRTNMGVNDVSANSETQSTTAGVAVAAAFQPVQAVEQVFTFFIARTGGTVVNGELRTLLILREFDRNLAATICITYRVIQQITQELAQTLFITQESDGVTRV